MSIVKIRTLYVKILPAVLNNKKELLFQKIDLKKYAVLRNRFKIIFLAANQFLKGFNITLLI